MQAGPQATPSPRPQGLRGSSCRCPLLLASGHLHSSPHTDLIAWHGPGPILRQHRLSCPQALEMPHHSPEPPSCNLQNHQPQGSPTLLCGSEGRGVAW